MHRLALDDERWGELHCRNGGATQVPHRLRYLLEHPDDSTAFADLWPELCSEGTTYSSGHAAVPYILDVADRRRSGSRAEHLVVIGLIVTCTDDRYGVRAPASVRQVIVDAYQASFSRAITLALDELSHHYGPEGTRYLLAAVAALRGYPKIAAALQSLDSAADCPDCGAFIDRHKIEG